MGLEDVRKDIDAIDVQIRDLLMRRLDCSYRVAEAKQAAGSTDVYRADREQEILDMLGREVPENRRAEYLAVVRKIMESSRMYQYGLLCEWNDDLFAAIDGADLVNEPLSTVTVRFTRPDRPNALAAILSMVGDYGFNVERIELVAHSESPAMATFDLAIRADATLPCVRQLLFQLSKETLDFRIISVG